MNGVLLVDKPKGWTSQDVVTKVKRTLKIKKVGHAGTLDPLATGLLVVLLGDATKLSDYLMADDKTYISEITLGVATNTLDSEGEIIDSKIVSKIENVDQVIESFIGPLEQTPPMFSAIKQDGKKMYELARKGISVERKTRNVMINSIKRLSDVVYFDGKAKFSFICNVTKGTYVRTLCEQIGSRLQLPAHMSELRRISSGSLNIEKASTIGDIIDGKYHIINMLDSLADYHQIILSPEQYNLVKNGVKINLDSVLDLEVLVYEDNLVAIYQKSENNLYKAMRVWN